MNLALEASRVSCEGRVGCLHQKLLIVICGPISTYITILIFWLLISCMKRGFAGLSSFLSTFDNILSTLHTIYLLADLIISAMRSAC